MLMRKCRWLPMACLAVCIGLPTPSWALGLGELEVESALNERFAGTIELLDAAGFQDTEIVVSLASREDFERVGVERFFYLTNLDFEVDLSGSIPQVNVSSTQPVAEPYLNFIVEVLWPRGRLLKEFTVLLDPPTFSAAPAPVVASPEQPVAQRTAPAPAPSRPAPAVQADSGTQVGLAPQRSAPAQPRRLPGDGVMTTRDDTLWKIAQRTLPSERVTVNQQMLALQRKNPQAFMRNNINLLKAGYMLDVPTEGEALSLTAQQATAEVAGQTRDWRDGVTSPQIADTSPVLDEAAPELSAQVDATEAAPAPAPRTVDSQGEVRIVANTGELASGTARGDDPSVNQLIEEKDTLARQVDELTYQLDREKEIAANEVTVKDRQLEVKDAEIAQLQEQMAQMRTALQDAQANQNQNQSPSPTAAETPWWMSPMVLLGVIGVLVLVLVVALVALRRSRVGEEDYADAADYEAEETHRESYVGAAEDTAADVETGAGAADEEPFIGDIEEDVEEQTFDAEFEDEVIEDDSLTDFADAQTEQGEAGEQAAAGQGETGDVIGEAEIYIAYGRYGEAANLLSGALANEPDRWDVRLKMLEVCVESHDQEAFSTHAQYLLDHCDDEEVLLACRDLEAQFDSSHVDLSDLDAEAEAPAEDDDLQTAAAETADALEDDADTLDLDLDNLEDSAEAADAGDDLDFELEFDAEDEDIAEATDAADADELVAQLDEETLDDSVTDALGGDLGIDFDPERDVAEQQDTAELEDLDTLESDELVSAADDSLQEVTDEAPEDAAEELADIEFNMSDDQADEIAAEDLDELLSELDVEEGATALAGSDDPGESAPAEPAIEAAADDDSADAGVGDDFDFDASGDDDINATKLDLAEAYVDMGDSDGAQDILSEVLEEGTPEQQQKAQEMLNRLAS